MSDVATGGAAEAAGLGIDLPPEPDDAPSSATGRPGITLVYVRAIAAARNPALGTVHKSVLYSLAARFYRDAECWPGGDTLRGDAGTSNGALYRALDDLCRWGIVRRSPPRKGRPSSTFSIDLARLATMEDLLPSPEPVSQPGRATNRSPNLGEGVSQHGRRGLPTWEKGSPNLGDKEIREEITEEAKKEILARQAGERIPGGQEQAASQPLLSAPATIPCAAPKAKPVRRSSSTKAPRPPKADPAEITRPVADAYVAAFTAGFGRAPLGMGAADRTCIKRLVAQVGADNAVRLVQEAMSLPAVRERFPSIRAISANPSAVVACIATQDLTEAELAEARRLFQANPDHAVTRTLKEEKRKPTRRELDELRRARGRTGASAPRQRIQRDATGDYSEENIRKENLAGLKALAEKPPEGFV